MTTRASLAPFWLRAVAACTVAACLSACGPDRRRAVEEKPWPVFEPVEEIVQIEGVGRAVEKLTRARTRVVWMWHQSDDPGSTDTYAAGNSHFLMGFDSRDGKGVRILLGEKDNYSRPMLTPDGETVVFTDKQAERKDGVKHYSPIIYALDWGAHPDTVRKIGEGFAVDVWREPQGGRTWVYAIEDFEPSGASTMEGKQLVRFRVHDAELREVLYEGAITPDNVQISYDGKRASGLFPWPDGGLLNLEDGTWRRTTGGCWTSLAPDDSHISWVFDGAHKTLRMFSGDGKTEWSMPINVGDEVGGKEVYHPRWSNAAHVFAYTGPYGDPGGGNPISVGAAQAEVYIGKFAPDLRSVEGWVRLTDNHSGDFYPDIWVEGAGASALDLAKVGVAAPGESGVPVEPEWPVVTEGAVFAWRDAAAENEIDGRRCVFVPQGTARFDHNFAMILDGGTFVADEASNAAIHEALMASGEATFEVTVTDRVTGDPVPGTSYRLFAYEWGEGHNGFAIYRVGDEVVLRVTAAPPGGGEPQDYPVRLGVLPFDNLTSLFFTFVFKEGVMTVYYASKVVDEVPVGEGGPVLAGWEPGQLVVGDTSIDPAHYHATVETVAVFSRALTADEVARNGRLRVDRFVERPRVHRARLRGKLAEAAETPSVESLDSYRRALVDYTYDVEEVLEGIYRDDKIVVKHWAILDRHPVAGLPKEIGQSYELVVEPVASHPELDGERQTDTSSVFLPPWLDVSPPRLEAATGHDDENP